jgi:hypothetical protein
MANDSAAAGRSQLRSVPPIIVFLVMAAIVLVAVGSLVLWHVQSIPSPYSAAALLLLEIVPTFDHSIGGDSQAQYTKAKQLESVRIASDVNLTQVLERQDVQATRWYDQHATPDDALPALRQVVAVDPMEGIAAVKVTATTDRPDEAALLANAVVENYLEHHAPSGEASDDTSRPHNVRIKLGAPARPPSRPH